MGAPVATRTTSTWAGTWSGVSTISDFPSQELSLPYTNERECGRMLTTQHMIGQMVVTNMVIYGFPKGPTWPNALRLTGELLQIVTTEVVLGGTGPRLIGGDFNTDAWGCLGDPSLQLLAPTGLDFCSRTGCKNLISSFEKMQLNGTSFGFPLKLLHSVRWLMWQTFLQSILPSR